MTLPVRSRMCASPPPMQPHACPRWPSSQCVDFKVTAELSELCARVSVCRVQLMSGLESRLGQFETRVDGSLSELHARRASIEADGTTLGNHIARHLTQWVVDVIAKEVRV